MKRCLIWFLSCVWLRTVGAAPVDSLLQQLNLQRLNYMAASEVLVFSANVREGIIKKEDIDKEWDILAG